jgi:predicted transcriptional regulator
MVKPSKRQALLAAEEGLVIDVLEHICERMEELGVTRAELARRLGTSPAYVTQVLRGTNITLRTLARIVHHLDGHVVVRIRVNQAK